MKISELDKNRIVGWEEEIEEQIDKLLDGRTLGSTDLNDIMIYLGLFDEEVVCQGDCDMCKYNDASKCIELSNEHVRRVVRQALERKNSIEVML